MRVLQLIILWYGGLLGYGCITLRRFAALASARGEMRDVTLFVASCQPVNEHDGGGDAQLGRKNCAGGNVDRGLLAWSDEDGLVHEQSRDFALHQQKDNRWRECFNQ